MIKLIIALSICVVLLLGCSKEEFMPYLPDGDSHQRSYQVISAEAAYAMMNESEDFVLLDVRAESEFRQVRIDGAILIPYNELAVRAADELSNKDAVILIYCQSGRRSEIAARVLVDMGYTNVFDFGGIMDWHFDTVSD